MTINPAPTPSDVNWGGATWQGSIDWPADPNSCVYDLAVRLEHGMTRHPGHPPYAFTMTGQHDPESQYPGGVSASAEMMVIGGHVGTHVDGLGHVAADGCIYGGRDVLAGQDWTSGVAVGSVEELPPLIGPGHLVDAERIFGRELTPADGIGAAEFDQWFSERPQPEPGSIVLVRTGRMRHWNTPTRYLALTEGIPGVSLSGAQWLSDREILATGADTVNYEHKPHLKTPSMSVHVHLLVEQGIPIMECMDLELLARDEVYDFFFVAAALRVGGSSGSPIRPLAIKPSS